MSVDSRSGCDISVTGHVVSFTVGAVLGSVFTLPALVAVVEIVLELLGDAQERVASGGPGVRTDAPSGESRIPRQ